MESWYCSWVCGCGGLAETAGDSYRHLSSKTDTSWKIERWMIHSVLVFSFDDHPVIFSFLSEMSFVTKDHFIWELLFLIVFYRSIISKRKRIRYRCILYYAFFSSHYHFFFINYFSGNQIFFLLIVIR
jgi:hypothetical protein